MRLVAYIEDYGNQEFPLEVGSVLKENINETLDSFVCHITNTSEELSLFPTQYVLIKDTDNVVEDKYFIIDSFTKEKLVFKDVSPNYFTYTLNLKSPTALLENIVVPNRTILHSLVGSNKTIGQVIKEMCDLYMPKIKMGYNDNGTLRYKYESKIDYTSIVSDTKFDVACPDLSWSTPTLREVLTTLMQYVGCIPIIKAYELSYIDLRKETEELALPTDKQYLVSESNSSDSYVNTLVSPLSKVLDNENKVVNEVIGFRDNKNVFLKQSDNLVLTTAFGIERVNKLVLNLTATATIIFTYHDRTQLTKFTLSQSSDSSTLIINTGANSVDNVKITFAYCIGTTNVVPYQSSIWGGITAQVEVNISHINANTETRINRSVFYPQDTPLPATFVKVEYEELEGVVSRWTSLQSLSYTINDFVFLQFDITDFVKEYNKAKLLDTDYTQLDDISKVTRETLTNNYYSTINFDYGSNEIYGFSKKWEYFKWLGNTNYVFIDALCEFITSQVGDLGDKYNDIIYEMAERYGFEHGLDTDYSSGKIETIHDVGSSALGNVRATAFNKAMLAKTGYSASVSPYGLLTFDIEYVPFNEINVKHHKEEVSYEIAKADTQESAILTFDTFSKREQQKINRLGNNIFHISQPQSTYSDSQDIGLVGDNFKSFNGSTIFQKETQFYSDFVVSNYVASKDYIMRDYFTALQNKYRAYEYTSSSESVLRKENETIFIRIGRDYVSNGSNKIYATDYSFISGVFYSGNALTYLIEKGDYYTSDESTTSAYFKNDLSLLTSGQSILFSYQHLDNVSYGPFIKPNGNLEELGGLIQSFYIEEESYNEKHEVHFTTFFFALTRGLLDTSGVYSAINGTALLPKVYNYATSSTLFQLRNQLSNDNYGADLSGDNAKRVYYKSINERLNETLQLEYYASDNDIKLSSMFAEFTQLKNKEILSLPLCIRHIGENEEMCETWTKISGKSLYNLNYSLSQVEGTNGVMKLELKTTSGTRYACVCIERVVDNEFQFVDLFRFDGFMYGYTFYFSLTDTKTDKVYFKDYNLYEQVYQVKKGVSSTAREIEKL